MKVHPFSSEGRVVYSSEVTKSQRNRRWQRRLQIIKKFHIQSSENKYKVVDLPVQKLLNDMTLD